MTGHSESNGRGTGDGPKSTADAADIGRAYGRKVAVDIITDQDSGDAVASDGGLSPAARRWMDATPGASLEDAQQYEKKTQLAREVSRTGSLPPRGDPAGPENYTRADIINTARSAMREYRELTEQTE